MIQPNFTKINRAILNHYPITRNLLHRRRITPCHGSIDYTATMPLYLWHRLHATTKIDLCTYFAVEPVGADMYFKCRLAALTS